MGLTVGGGQAGDRHRMIEPFTPALPHVSPRQRPTPDTPLHGHGSSGHSQSNLGGRRINLRACGTASGNEGAGRALRHQPVALHLTPNGAEIALAGVAHGVLMEGTVLEGWPKNGRATAPALRPSAASMMIPDRTTILRTRR